MRRPLLCALVAAQALAAAAAGEPLAPDAGASAPPLAAAQEPTPEPASSQPDRVAPLPPPLVRHTDLTRRLKAPAGVDRWEPSGAAARGDRLWVVSDKGAYLAAYALPLHGGANTPVVAHVVDPPKVGRVKWEGLELDEGGGLLLLEAISRSVWRCGAPEQGCPDLTPVPTDVNPRLNSAAPVPFHYIMFESLARTPSGLWVGTRGLQARAEQGAPGGLRPWTAWAQLRDEPLSPISPPLNPSVEYSEAETRGLVMGAHGLSYARRSYGVSGAVYDEARAGLWLTLSAEREEEASREAVSGLLAFSPLAPSAPLSSSAPLSICARFDMKPEGVTLAAGGGLIVVFDEDLDRKLGARHPERFPLEGDEDFVWEAPLGVVEGCLF